MLTYWREHHVTWGECDPFGLVYYPHMLAWFNDTEHALWRALDHPIEDMIARDRTTFVMGEVAFRFTGPIRYGEPVLCMVRVEHIGRSSLRWGSRCVAARDGAPVYEGSATRIYAHISADNSLRAAPITADLRALLQGPSPASVPLSAALREMLDW
jgi:acyl-CoA thioesterase FadM